jgi:uncharacterized membrane protein
MSDDFGSTPPPSTPPPPAWGEPTFQQPPPPQYAPPAQSSGLSDTAAGALAYITFIPALIFLLVAPYNQKPFIKFHAWQCITLTLTSIVVSVGFTFLAIIGFHLFGLIFLLHLLVNLTLFVFWLIAIIKASKGEWYKIPLIGDLAQNFAGKV